MEILSFELKHDEKTTLRKAKKKFRLLRLPGKEVCFAQVKLGDIRIRRSLKAHAKMFSEMLIAQLLSKDIDIWNNRQTWELSYTWGGSKTYSLLLKPPVLMRGHINIETISAHLLVYGLQTRSMVREISAIVL